MNVLLVNSYDNGGAANACIRLHKGLRSVDVDSKLLIAEDIKKNIPQAYSFREYVRGYSPLKNIKQRVREKLHHQQEVKIKSSLPSAYYNLATSVYDITEHPLYQEADIIHLHWVARFLDYPSFFKKNKKPVVWTLHDMFAFSGGYHYDMDFPVKAYQKAIQKNLTIKQKALPKEGITVVSPSRWLLQESSTSITFQKYPHHHIMYAVDTNVFRNHSKQLARTFFNIPTEKKIILFVADHVNSPLKGINSLLEAVQRIRREDVLLCSVGGNIDKTLLKGVEVLELGRIYDERLMALAYSIADLFVVPSIQDNLPNTVLEALCCGIPVVGFPIGGIPDMISTNINGLICEDVSVENLKRSILEVINQKVCFNRESIREDAVKRFGLIVQAQQYQYLYKQLIKQ